MMLTAGSWIWNHRRPEVVCFEVKRVPNHQLACLTTAKVANVHEVRTRCHVDWQDQRVLVRNPINQPKRRWNNVHFPITDENVTVAAEAFNALVFVNTATTVIPCS
jgi:hypothetical protein